MTRRIKALLWFCAAAVWPYFWEFVRSLIYERGSHIVTPILDSVPLDQFMHWGPLFGFAGIGVFLFWRTRPSKVQQLSTSSLSPTDALGTHKQQPDIDARAAFFQILERSEWREHQLTTTDTSSLVCDWIEKRLSTAIHRALRNSDLKAWGEEVLSRTEDTPEKPIPEEAWDRIEIDFDRSSLPRTSAHWKVGSRNAMSTAWAGIKFSKKQVFQLFPLLPQQQLSSPSWRPVSLGLEYISEKISDTDTANCWPAARKALRQAAYDKRVKIRGRKQLLQHSISKGDYSDLHTDIDSEYWTNSEINAIATSPSFQKNYHVNPQTAYAWGPLGVDERNRYAELLVNWPDIIREWP